MDEETEMEKESLASIFDDCYHELSEDKIQIRIQPQDGQFSLDLVVQYFQGYPETLPTFEFSSSPPLEPEFVSHLTDFLAKQVEEHKGFPMVYAIIQQLEEELQYLATLVAKGLFLNLPHAIFHEIVQYLKLEDIYQLMQTSTQLLGSCTRPEIFRHFVMQLDENYGGVDYRGFLEARAGFERRIQRMGDFMIPILPREGTGNDWPEGAKWQTIFKNEMQLDNSFRFHQTNFYSTHILEEGELFYQPQTELQRSHLGTYHLLSPSHPLFLKIYPKQSTSFCNFLNQEPLGLCCFSFRNTSGQGSFFNQIASVARGDLWNIHRKYYLINICQVPVEFKVALRAQQLTAITLMNPNKYELLGPIYPEFKGNQLTDRSTWRQYFYSNTVLTAVIERLRGKPIETKKVKARVWVVMRTPLEKILEALCPPCVICGQLQRAKTCTRCEPSNKQQ